MSVKSRILIVDDEAEVVAMFEKYLRLKGFEVATASNALDALRVQKRDPVELVLSDYNMPQMSGIDLLKEFYVLDPTLPVILMSGAADMRTATEALREHAFDFLTKPVDAEELVRTIHLALQRKSAAALPEPADHGRVLGPIYASTKPEYPGLTILAFNKPLDQYHLLAYEAAFKRLESDGARLQKLVVVLKEVEYINNVGLNFLVEKFKEWSEQHRMVVLAQISDPVQTYLKRLGYLDQFPHAPTVAQAALSIVARA